MRADCSSVGSDQNSAQFFQNAATVASGCACRAAGCDLYDFDMLRQTKGTALTVTDEDIAAGGRGTGSLEGIFAAPEGAAT